MSCPAAQDPDPPVAPRTIEREILDEYRTRQTRSLRAKYLVPVTDACGTSRSGLVLLRYGAYAVESAYNRSLLATRGPITLAGDTRWLTDLTSMRARSSLNAAEARGLRGR